MTIQDLETMQQRTEVVRSVAWCRQVCRLTMILNVVALYAFCTSRKPVGTKVSKSLL